MMVQCLFRVFVGLVVGLLLSAGSAMAQRDMTGTPGMPCFPSGTCAIGLACNEAFLCENCGGSGQRVCEDGTCMRADPPWAVVGSGRRAYCAHTVDDARARANCGTAGFLMCEGDNSCWGEAVALAGTRLCIGCGFLGQPVCDDGMCRESIDRAVPRGGRCVPPDRSGSGNDGGGPVNLFGVDPAARPSFDEFLEQTAPEPDGEHAPAEVWTEDRPLSPVPGLENLPAILRNYPDIVSCGCFASDGRNGLCRENGCIEPPDATVMFCFWSCTTATGDTIKVRCRDGVLLP